MNYCNIIKTVYIYIYIININLRMKDVGRGRYGNRISFSISGGNYKDELKK